jgi:lysophospholipase L1-like esterase
MRKHAVLWIVAALVVAPVLLAPSLALAAVPAQVPAVLCRARNGLGNVLAKLEAGQEVRIAYFGGSITAANGWRPKSLAWFQQNFPKAKVQEINAAIGGTGSDLGVFRYQQDVLQHKPDLVFVEFSVNDGGAPPESIERSMEGIVRQTWRADPAIDLCFVYTFVVGYAKDLDGGVCPQATSAHERIAQHYGIPSINVALRVAESGREGRLVFKAEKDDKSPQLAGKLIFSNDGVHPLDAGHELYVQVIREAMPEIQKQSKARPHELKTPLRSDNWEKAKLVPVTEKMLQGNWRQLDRQQGLGKNFGNRLPVLWEGSKPGDKLQFRFTGTMAGLYDLMGPDAGQVVWTVDGRPGGPRPRFDRYCTYHRLASLRFVEGLEDQEHTVTVEIHPEQPDRSVVLDQVRHQPGFDPKKYQGTKVWIGCLMMIGDLLP